jgi:lipid-binding SYLF domain-containing protein
MNKSFRSILAFCALTVSSQLAQADTYSDTVTAFKNAGETTGFFRDAYGYAVFPSIGKAGLGIGGAHGKGRVFSQGAYVGNSSMTQITVGFQMGGQVYSQIILFEDQRALEEFISGNFEFGAQATAVAITAAVSAETSTGGGSSAGVSGGQNDATMVHGGYRKGMAIFTIAKGGLMYEAAIGGQKFSYTAK